VFLTAIAAGLLVGLVYCLVKVRVREPSVFALIGLAVMLLGQITAYLYPFGIGLLLGLAYDSFEEEWYGSAIADSARGSYRLRLFLKNSVVGWVSRCLWSGDFADRSAVTPLRRDAQLSNVFDIRNPPLRERCADIVILARAFQHERGMRNVNGNKVRAARQPGISRT
jgi:XapX domain-containing protein